MQTSTALLKQRRFLPLFVTQLLGAFNDSFYRTAMVMLVIYSIFSDPAQEAQFSTIAQALFMLPFFLLSAAAGQLADSRDKAAIIRIVKTAEILIMIAGAAGILLHNIPLMLFALFAMGVHSTFFGPIKYAILPQHLGEKDVLAGTGLVEAGTYVAILLGTIVGGSVPPTWAARWRFGDRCDRQNCWRSGSPCTTATCRSRGADRLEFLHGIMATDQQHDARPARSPRDCLHQLFLVRGCAFGGAISATRQERLGCR